MLRSAQTTLVLSELENHRFSIGLHMKIMCIFRSLTSSKLIWIARPVPEILHFSDSNDLERAKNKFVLALRAESPPTFLFFCVGLGVFSARGEQTTYFFPRASRGGCFFFLFLAHQCCNQPRNHSHQKVIFRLVGEIEAFED